MRKSQEVSIPADVHIEQSGGTPIAPVSNGFLITWVGTYHLFVDDEPYVELS